MDFQKIFDIYLEQDFQLFNDEHYSYHQMALIWKQSFDL